MNDHDKTEDKHNLNRDDMRQLFDEYLPKPSHIADKPRFFISYARDDGEAYAKDLRARLIPIFGENAIWRDREGIIANNEAGWWKQITEALDNVEYMLLIASPKAMVSPVVRKEIRYARSKGVTVCPILLPDKHHHPDFDNLPVGISQKHFYDLTHQWETLIKQLQTHGIGTKTPFSAPDMPKNFVQRPDIFNALKGYLLAQSEADATKNPVTISTALKGAGGFGKTVMATALAHDEAIQTAYLDGIVWVELGETPDMLFAMNTLYNQISPKAGSFSDMTTATKAVKDLMTGKNILLIVDDVWKAYHMQPFLESNPTGATLVTTRYVDVVIAAHADLHRVDVDEMKPAEAVQLLMSNIAHQATPAVTILAERLGNWALMMTLANAMLRKRLQRQGATFVDAVAWLNDELDEEGIISITSEQVAEVRHQSAGKAIEISFRTVDDDKRNDARMRYLQLGIFPEGASIPISALYRLWGCSEHRAEKYAEQLDDLSLVKYNVSTQTLTLHDVVWGYAKEVLGDDARANHQRLIDGYGDLHTLPDEYAWRNIGYHLIGANQPKQLRGLLLTYGWLDKKLHATDTNALLGDCALLLKQGKDEYIRLVRSAISMSAHVLDKDKKALAHQLAGRLMHRYTKVDEIRAFWDNITPPTNSLFPINNGYDALNPAGGMLLCTMKHEGRVNGVLVLIDGRILSWSNDTTLRIWERNGQLVKIMIGHKGKVTGATQFPDGRILSWSGGDTNNNRNLAVEDADLYIWNPDGDLLKNIVGHEKSVNGAIIIHDGQFLSWSNDNTIRLWDKEGKSLKVFIGHEDIIRGVKVLSNEKVLSWSVDNTIRLWNLDGLTLNVTKYLADYSNLNVIILKNEHILSWSWNGIIGLWDNAGKEISSINVHQVISDVYILPDGRVSILYHTKKSQILSIGINSLNVVNHHDIEADGILYLPNGYMVSWGGIFPSRLFLWDELGNRQKVLEGHYSTIIGACMLTDNQLLSWSTDNTLRLWDMQNNPLDSFIAHPTPIRGLLTRKNGGILSWCEMLLRLWDKDGESVAICVDHALVIIDVIELGDGRILSCSEDTTLMLWSSEGDLISILWGHEQTVTGALELSDGKILSWSDDTTLILWDSFGKLINVLKGHKSPIGGAIELKNGNIFSWAKDIFNDYDMGSLCIWDSSGNLLSKLIGDENNSYYILGKHELADKRFITLNFDNRLYLWLNNGVLISKSEEHYDGDSEKLLLWGIQNNLTRKDIFVFESVNIRLFDFSVHWSISRTDLIVYDPKKRIDVQTFHSDAPFSSFIVTHDRMIVAGDYVGRVLFLRWVGEEGASNE